MSEDLISKATDELRRALRHLNKSHHIDPYIALRALDLAAALSGNACSHIAYVYRARLRLLREKLEVAKNAGDAHAPDEPAA
jgi:hypothetical protein